MEKMILWLSWANALFISAVYTRIFERPAWWGVILAVILTVGYIAGLIMGSKEEEE